MIKSLQFHMEQKCFHYSSSYENLNENWFNVDIDVPFGMASRFIERFYNGEVIVDSKEDLLGKWSDFRDSNIETITLHYAEGYDLGKDIVEVHLNETRELVEFLQAVIAKDNKSTVYLFTSNHGKNIEDEHNEYSNELIVESDPLTLMTAIMALDYSGCECFLQEYSSFEDAYAVALNMRELNPLCYLRNEPN